MPDSAILKAYLDGMPLLDLPNFEIDVALPQRTRFERMHIVAGSGHGTAQTLQHLISCIGRSLSGEAKSFSSQVVLKIVDGAVRISCCRFR